MNDVYWFVLVGAGAFFILTAAAFLVEKAKALNNEDRRDQEAHEERMKSGLYQR